MPKVAKRTDRRERKRKKPGKGPVARSLATAEDKFARSFKESRGRVDPKIKLGF